MDIRPAREEDRPGIERVAAAGIERLSNSPSVRQWGDDFRRAVASDSANGHTVVANAGGEIAGIGSVSEPRRHPHHAFMRVTVAPEHRGRGLGSGLFDALGDHDPGPYVVREFHSDPATIDFYRRRGFTVGEIALEGVVDPGAAGPSEWIDSVTATRPAQFHIVAEHHQAAHASLADLAGIFDGLYRWSHRWSPPLPLSVDDALGTYLGDRLPDTTFHAYQARRLVGAALLSTSPFGAGPNTVKLVWAGVGDPTIADAAEITTTLAAHCLRVARHRGWRVEVEASSAHPFFYDCLRAIPGTALFHDLTMMISGPPGLRRAGSQDGS